MPAALAGAASPPMPHAGGVSPGQSSAKTHFIAVAGSGSGWDSAYSVASSTSALIDSSIRASRLGGQDAGVDELAAERRQAVASLLRRQLLLGAVLRLLVVR